MTDLCLISPLLDGQPCPVVLWDASLHPEGHLAVKLTWGEYQNTLKARCLRPKSSSTKPDSNCSTVHHYEWSKLALFDFLLQVINRCFSCFTVWRTLLKQSVLLLFHECFRAFFLSTLLIWSGISWPLHCWYGQINKLIKSSIISIFEDICVWLNFLLFHLSNYKLINF